MARSVIKNNDAAMLMEPNIAITGVTLTNYQSYIQNGRWYFSGNVKNNSGSSLPIYQSILTVNANTDTFSGNGLNVTDSNNVKPVIVLIQAGGLRFGTVIPDGNTVWVNASARLTA